MQTPEDIWYHAPLRDDMFFIRLDENNIEDVIVRLCRVAPLHIQYRNPHTIDGTVYIDRHNIVKQSKMTMKLRKAITKEKIDIDLVYTHRDISIERGNSAPHKMTFCNSLSVTNTCQNSDNTFNYSAGFASGISNGYMLPMILHENGKIVGRMVTREMYDIDGIRYIVLDRMYFDCDRETKSKLYQQIVQYLKQKGYNVAVCAYTQHGCATPSEYVAKLEKEIEELQT